MLWSPRSEHVEPRSVIDDHPQRVVLAVFQVIGQIERECAVTAPVFADIAPVNDQVGHGSGLAEADENPPTGPLFRYGDIFHVIAYPPEIVVSAAQASLSTCAAGSRPAPGRWNLRYGLKKRQSLFILITSLADNCVSINTPAIKIQILFICVAFESKFNK